MDKVFVFGSFSEDEALLLQSSAPRKVQNAEKQAAATQAAQAAATQAISSQAASDLAPALQKCAVTDSDGDSTRSSQAPAPKPSTVETNGVRGPAPTIRLQIAPGESLFLPRGLFNCGNTCFLNSTLQALLSCTPFWHLLQTLQRHTIPRDHFPVLHAFSTFAGEFEDTRSSGMPARRQYIGKPFTPSMFDPVLLRFNPEQPTTKGSRRRQEDAQEFLSFLMNQMHEELVKLEGGESVENVADEDDWETVGPKNRTAITRTYSVRESPLREIFGGQQQSIVKTKGFKPSATVEPFYLLHLEISSVAVHSVEDALKFYAAPESLEGYRSARGKTEDASRSVKIKTLPKVLILHLKRFSFGAKGTGKLHKPIRVPAYLVVGRELLISTSGSSSEARKYELVATITHHGMDPSAGHYTADAKQMDGKWLKIDDSTVRVVSSRFVFEQDQAYVLFYRKLS